MQSEDRTATTQATAEANAASIGKASRDTKLNRELILNTAMRLFRTQGYQSTSLEQLADVFQVTRQALYYYYDSKEDLLWDISLRAQRLHEVEDEILALNLSPLERLAAFLWNYAYRTAMYPDASWCFFQEDRALATERQSKVAARRRQFTSRVTEAYADAARHGLIQDRDPKLAAYLLLGGISWLSRWYQSGGGWSPKLVADTITEMNLAGVLTEEGRKVYALPSTVRAVVPDKVGVGEARDGRRASGKAERPRNGRLRRQRTGG